jgi:hypothetical protein
MKVENCSDEQKHLAKLTKSSLWENADPTLGHTVSKAIRQPLMSAESLAMALASCSKSMNTLKWCTLHWPCGKEMRHIHRT